MLLFMKMQSVRVLCLLTHFCLGMFTAQADWMQREALVSGEKTSRAVFSDSGETSPVITITEDTIMIRHQQSGSGVVEGTSLRGPQSYQFTREGTYKVTPGTYKHIVYGKVPSQGSISSIVRYR